MQQSKKYNRVKLILGISSGVLQFLGLIFYLFSGSNNTIFNFIKPFSNNPYMQLLLFAAISASIFSVISLPFSFYSGYIIEKKYNLSNQTIWSWMWENIKSVLIGLIIGIPLLLGFYYMIMHLQGNWWIGFGAIVFFFSVILALIFPIVIFPLFYKLSPITNPELISIIEQLMAKTGLQISKIAEFNMSKTTKKGNAMLTGLGKTKQVLLGDTLTKEFSNEEIESIIAHELGHSHHKHILKNVIIGTVQSFLIYWLMSWLHYKLLPLFGYQSMSDIPGLIILLIVASVISFIQQPIFAALSRYFEYQADAFAIQVTRKSEVFINALEKLNLQNLGDREPHPLVEWYMYSHPSLQNRVKAIKNLEIT